MTSGGGLSNQPPPPFVGHLVADPQEEMRMLFANRNIAALRVEATIEGFAELSNKNTIHLVHLVSDLTLAHHCLQIVITKSSWFLDIRFCEVVLYNISVVKS